MSFWDDDDAASRVHRRTTAKAAERRKFRHNPYEVREKEEKKEEERQNEQHPESIGFDLPFRALLLGQSGAGKTHTFVNQMLLDPKCLRHRFRKIICFSPTMATDPVWKQIYTDDEAFVKFDYYDDDIMRQVYLEQRHIFRTCRELAEPILVYIDDNAYKIRDAKNHEWLDRTCVSGRHFDISVAILIQKKHMASPTQWEQATNMLIWGTASAKSLDSSHEQMGAMLDKKVYFRHFCEITSEPYAFMHCRKAKKGGVMQIWKGLTECIIDNVNSLSAMQRLEKAQNYQSQQGPTNPVSVLLKTAGQSGPTNGSSGI